MMSLKTADYGTVEPLVQQQRSSKKTVAGVAALLLCAAVVAFSFSTGSNKALSVVDSNIQRGDITPISDDLKEIFESVCNDMKTRFVIAVFDKDGKTVIPALKQAATMHWENDFKSFEDQMRMVTSLSDRTSAFAVYNFPVWKDESRSEYEVYSSFVDFEADGTDMQVHYHSGTYLGAIELAAKCAPYKINVVETDNYESACGKLSKYGVTTDQCRSIENVDCPYTHLDQHVNPCESGACAATDGASFANPSEGNLGQECCSEIKQWCSGAGQNTPGCGDYAMTLIFENHCNPEYVSDSSPEVTLYHPVLVEEQRQKEQEEQERKDKEEEAKAAEAAAEAAAGATDSVCEDVGADVCETLCLDSGGVCCAADKIGYDGTSFYCCAETVLPEDNGMCRPQQVVTIEGGDDVVAPPEVAAE